MPTIAVTHRKRYEDIINGPFSLYVRETALGGTLVDLGHTGKDIQVMLTPVSERIDKLQTWPYRTKVQIKARLMQSASTDVIATLESLRGKLADVLFYEEEMSPKNFYFKNMNIAVDGDAVQSFDAASPIPLVLTGYIKSYSDLYKRSLQEFSINLLTQYQPDQTLACATSFPSEFSTGDLDDAWAGFDNSLPHTRLNNEFTYYDPVAGVAPQGFSAFANAFDLKFKKVFRNNEANAGGRIGIHITSRNGGDPSGSVSYVLSFFCDSTPVNLKTRLYVEGVDRETEEFTTISNDLLPALTLGTTPYEFRLSLRDDVLYFYIDNVLLLSQAVQHDDDGYQFGLFRKDEGGSAPTLFNYIYDVRYATEII